MPPNTLVKTVFHCLCDPDSKIRNHLTRMKVEQPTSISKCSVQIVIINNKLCIIIFDKLLNVG